MSDREFENRIQEHLGSLQLQPSPDVWFAVEKRVRRRRRRRRLLLWLPLFLIFLSTGSYYLYQGKQGSPALVSNELDAKIQKKPNGLLPESASAEKGGITKTNPGGEGNTAAKVAGKGYRKTSVAQSTPSSISPEQVPAGLYKTSDKKITAEESNPTLKQGNTAKRGKDKTPGYIVDNGDGSTRVPVSPQQRPIDSNLSRIGKDEGNTERNGQTSLLDRILGPAIIKRVSLSPEMSSIEPGPLATQPENIVGSVDSVGSTRVAWRRPWSFGLTTDIGISRLTDNGLFSNGQTGPNNMGTNASSFPIYSAIVLPPSPTMSGFAFSAAGFAERNISGRFSFRMGLGYSYYSTSLYTGAHVSSSMQIGNTLTSLTRVDNYYTNTRANTFVNQYHYLQLPLSIRFRLNPAGRLPLSWNGGLIWSHLLSSRALLYDSGTGVYYQDPGAYRKDLLQMHTGIALKLFRYGLHPLELGPDFRYSFNSLYNSSTTGDKHFLFLGLQAHWYLRK